MKQLVADFITAITGKEKEFTKGSINRAIFMLSVPMILEMLMESLFAVVDAFFVSNYVGVNGVATVGLTESVITLIYAVAIGLSMAATAMVSRRIGEKRPDEAAVAAMQAIIISSLIAIVLGIVGFFSASSILEMMGASEEVIQEGVTYTRILFASNIVIMLLFMLNSIFRGAGDASIAMRSLWIANILNIILDPCLILGLGPFPELGLTGAAIATSIGRGTGVLYQLSILFGMKSIIQIQWQHFELRFDIIRRLLKVGLTGILQFVIASASWIALMRLMANFGSAAVAGYTIAIRIIIFTILPAWGMANAAATLVGQNLGAGQAERAEQSVWRTAFFTMLFLSFVAFLFYSTADSIIQFFFQEGIAYNEGVKSLKIICLGYIFFAYGMVIGQAFNGAGDTATPTWLNFICFWLLQVPLAYLLSHTFYWGTSGVYWAVAGSESVLALLSVWAFKRGTWKKVKI
ncbi:MAG: MATE family efflux transporter [Bacteroidota bacterium]